MLITKTVFCKVHSRNIKHLEDKGYILPKRISYHDDIVAIKGLDIEIKVEDLNPGSHTRVKCNCDYPDCDKILDMPWYTYLKHNHNGKTYCDKHSNTVFLSGENNGRYNSDLTKDEREHKRHIDGYDIFIKKVLARDKYICQCCGTHNDIQVHHLDGYDWCEEKRIDVTNGITLCKNCHKNFHSLYGFGKNTKEQFEEWIGKTLEKLKDYDGPLPTNRLIYCVEKDLIIDNVTTYAKEIGVNRTSIYGAIRRGNRCKGLHYVWLV